MGIPLLTLLEQLNISAQSIALDTEFSGIRLRYNDPVQHNTLYLQPDTQGCALICNEVRIQLNESWEDWLNRLYRQAELFHRWELKLRDFLLTRRLNEAMGLLSEIFGNAVYLVDSSFRVLAIDTNEEYSELSAIWKHLVNYGYIPYHILTGLRNSGEMDALQSQKEPSLFYSQWFNNRFINCCLHHNGNLWGHLFVVGYRKRFTDGDLAYARWVGQLLEELLPQLSDPVHSRNHNHEAFFLHVIERSLTDPVQIREQLRPLGWNMEGQYQSVAIRSDAEYPLLAPLLCDKLENRFPCRTLIWKEVVLAVFPADQFPTGVAGMLSAFVRQESLCAGISDIFDGFYRLPLNAEQAVCALNLGNPLPGTLNTYQDIAISHLIQNLNRDFNLNMFCDKAVFRLRDYDRKNDSEYLHTLEVFLEQERRLMDTAKALYIHRNTLIYRIERIQKLTGLDLNDPDVRLRALLSCRIMSRIGQL